MASKFESWFKDRSWRVVTEAAGEHELADGVVITYVAGEFTINQRGKYKTPLGQVGRLGVLVAELDPDGQDTGEMAAFSMATLHRAQERYGMIAGLA